MDNIRKRYVGTVYLNAPCIRHDQAIDGAQ